MNISTSIKILNNYRILGDKVFAQLTDEQMLWQPNTESNSIAVIVQHMSGNMLSRFTDFLTSDGEKPWRQRDAEFGNSLSSKEEIVAAWNKGWECVITELEKLSAEDIQKTVFIRGEAHSVQEAVERQIAHYASHVGQIIYIGKILLNNNWKTLSIPRGQSREFNASMGMENEGRH